MSKKSTGREQSNAKASNSKKLKSKRSAEKENVNPNTEEKKRIRQTLKNFGESWKPMVSQLELFAHS